MNYYLDVLKKYAVFSGRATRSEFWYFVLINFIVTIVLGVVDKSMGLGGILGIVYGLAVLIPGIAVGARRLHDIGKSGWMQLIILIPLIGLIWLIVLFALESYPGKNKYGEVVKS
jgi:uncharacterized membrane protein YhaH (DUF805 family)